MKARPHPPIKLAYAPTYRNDFFGYSASCRQTRDGVAHVLASLDGVELVDITEAGEAADPATGSTKNGAFSTGAEAEGLAAHFAARGVAGLVVNPTDFASQNAVGELAGRLGVPTFVFANAEPPPHDPPEQDLGRVSDSYCGTLAITSALWRRRLPYRFGGVHHHDDAALRNELETFARAVAVTGGLTHARIGQFGQRPEPFECCAYDEAALLEKFHLSVVPIDLWPIIKHNRETPDDDPAVHERAEAIQQSVAEHSVHESYFAKAAKLELFLEKMVDAERLDALAVQEWGNLTDALGINANATYGRLTDAGLPTACESDVLGAIGMLAADRVTGGGTRPFFIDWTIRHRTDPTLALAWHGGNAPPSLAIESAKITLRSQTDAIGDLPSAVEHVPGQYGFEVRPGAVTVCALVHRGGEWSMFVAPAEAVPDEDRQGQTWCWLKLPGEPGAFYRTLAENGFTQHATLVHGDHVAALRLACDFLGVSVVTPPTS
jgi:L-fucose isomerase-like protein